MESKRTTNNVKECDMRGFLSFLVLRLIFKQPMSGAAITAEIAQRKGSRPSPGTIYPVLKQLLANGWIEESICPNAKEKWYTVTPAGKVEARKATKRFVTYFSDMASEFR